MKKIFTLLWIAVSSSLAFSQATVDNSGFENWDDIVVLDSLEMWTSSTQEYQLNAIPVDNSYQISPGFVGSYAIHLETMEWFDLGAMEMDTLLAYVTQDNPSNGFVGTPYSDTIDLFTGWYRCDIQPGDSAMVIIECRKNGMIYSNNLTKIGGSTATWTQFQFPIINGATMAPDSVFIGLTSSDAFLGNEKPGSWIEFDDLKFEHTVGSMTPPSPIDNNGFELLYQETIEQPSDWWSFDPMMYNQLGAVYTSKSTDAAVGSYSMQIESTFENVTNNIPSIVTNGYFDMMVNDFAGGIPFIAQPTQMSFQYKYTPSLTDTAWVIIDFWNAATGSLISTFDTLMSAATWTPRTLNFIFTEAPDSLRVSFYSGNNLGSVLLIDDIQFIGGDVSIEQNTANKEWNYYPNPTNDIVTITFEESTEIEIIDVTGKRVYINSDLNTDAISISTADWNNGIYFIRLNRSGVIETKKLIVKH